MKQGAASNFAFIEPMNALRVRDLPAGNWLYELKFCGYRALAFKAGKEVRLFSRNRTNFDNAYPQLIDALKSLNAKEATIDGEITALDDEGKSSFQLLQSYGQAEQTPLVYYALTLSLELRGCLKSPHGCKDYEGRVQTSRVIDSIAFSLMRDRLVKSRLFKHPPSTEPVTKEHLDLIL